MSLTSAGLKTSILTAISGLSLSERADEEVFWDVLSGAIINYLVTNTTVTVTVATTGTAAAQTGTGTGTIS